MAIRWRNYKVNGFYDELIRTTGRTRDWARPLCRYFSSLKDSDLQEYKAAAELAIRVQA